VISSAWRAHKSRDLEGQEHGRTIPSGDMEKGFSITFGGYEAVAATLANDCSAA